MAELREQCARTTAAAHTDPEARRRRIHQRRSLRSYTDSEGEWHLHCRNNPEVGARVMAALDLVRDEIFRQSRAEDRREPPEAYAADALVEMARRSSAGVGADSPVPVPTLWTGPPKIIVRVDLGALLRGAPTEGEVCEIAGFGPVAVSAVRDLIDTDDPFLTAVVTRGANLVGVAHLGRRPNARQQTALQWLYPSCANEACHAQARLDYEHRVDWARTHLTVLDLLDRLCRHCHALKTRQNWSLVEGRGKRPLVPPDDPRHPRHPRERSPAIVVTTRRPPPVANPGDVERATASECQFRLDPGGHRASGRAPGPGLQ